MQTSQGYARTISTNIVRDSYHDLLARLSAVMRCVPVTVGLYASAYA